MRVGLSGSTSTSISAASSSSSPSIFSLGFTVLRFVSAAFALLPLIAEFSDLACFTSNIDRIHAIKRRLKCVCVFPCSLSLPLSFSLSCSVADGSVSFSLLLPLAAHLTAIELIDAHVPRRSCRDQPRRRVCSLHASSYLPFLSLFYLTLFRCLQWSLSRVALPALEKKTTTNKRSHL